MEIKVGQIVNIKHLDDNDKEQIHPFVIIGISHKYLYGLQCSSVKEEDNKSYFSRNNIEYYHLQYSDTDYETDVRTDEFQRIDPNNILEIICEPNWLDYNRLVQEILFEDWGNDEFFNAKQIKEIIKHGINHFNDSYTITWKS